ncbi:MAG: tetratricopeptide repeat protein [Pseudomonadota bacterium]
MAKIKTKKKEVLDPEAAVSLWVQVQEYVQENMRQLGAIALIVAVVAGGITIWQVTKSRSEREAVSQFNEAMNIMTQRAGKGAEAEASYAQALEKFKAITEKHSGTPSGAEALLYAGNCCYNLKKYDEAITWYKKFLDEAGSSLSYMKPFAYEGLGYACEGKGAYKEALEYFEKQQSAGPADAGSMVLLNLARCYELENNREKACSLYREFMEKQPASSFKDLAQTKVESLCGKK